MQSTVQVHLILSPPAPAPKTVDTGGQTEHIPENVLENSEVSEVVSHVSQGSKTLVQIPLFHQTNSKTTSSTVWNSKPGASFRARLCVTALTIAHMSLPLSELMSMENGGYLDLSDTSKRRGICIKETKKVKQSLRICDFKGWGVLGRTPWENWLWRWCAGLGQVYRWRWQPWRTWSTVL